MTEGQKLTRAMVRLEAFKILEGWGTVVKNGDEKTVTVWNMNERKEEAAKLADWAMGDTP